MISTARLFVLRAARWVMLVACAVLVLQSAAAARAQGLPTAKPENVGMSSDRLKRLDARIQDYIDKQQIAGAVTLVARKGKVVHYEAQGMNWIEEKKAMEKDNIFVMMSMTKPVVSTALMMLYEDGKFLLTDPISKWIPEFANMQVMEEIPSPNGGAPATRLVPARPITVRHALTHTTGVNNGAPRRPNPEAAGAPPVAGATAAAPAPAAGQVNAAAPAAGARSGRGGRGAGRRGADPATATRPAGAAGNEVAGAAPSAVATEPTINAPGAAAGAAAGARGGARGGRVLADSVVALARNPLHFQPGTEWEYGSSTDIVALLAERISGQNMDDFLRERIFKPLKMTDTYYNVPENKTNRKAAVYRPVRENENKIELSQGQRFNPATTYFGGVAGLSSTAADYFRFAQMILNGGELDGVRLLSPKTVDLMLTNHIGELPVALKGPGYGFGLGFSILRDPGKSYEPLSPGSAGWGGAWGTYFFIDPVEEMIGILLIQITSYNHFTIRQDLTLLANQAITDAQSGGAHKALGYTPLK